MNEMGEMLFILNDNIDYIIWYFIDMNLCLSNCPYQSKMSFEEAFSRP